MSDLHNRIAQAIYTDNAFGWTEYPYQVDTQQHPLRDRIANILYQELSVELPAAIRGADMVMAALGLREELRYPNRQPQWSFMPPQRHRYVTEWTTDE